MEPRKGIDILEKAFSAEFSANDSVCLYIRSELTDEQKKFVTLEVKVLATVKVKLGFC